MPKPPRISSALAEMHQGETAISLLNGKVIAFGKNVIAALKKAKKIIKRTKGNATISQNKLKVALITAGEKPK